MDEPEFQTQLVDFESLEKADASGKRSELARHVVNLFALISETCSVEQLGVYDMVLVRLSDMVEAEVRRHISERLAHLRRVPERTVQKLARDAIEVAQPILVGSVALTDADLMDVAATLGIGHASAIAERDVLSDVVTDALIDMNNVELHKKIVANRNASISGEGFKKLLSASLNNEDLQIGLSERADIPDRIIAAFVSLATDAVRKRMEKSGCIGDLSKVEAAGTAAMNKMSNEYWLSRYDFESAWQKVVIERRQPVIDEKLLRQFAMQDRFAEGVAAFSVIAGLSFEQAKHWLVRLDPTPFLVTARALSFDKTTVKAMLAMGAWRHRLSAEERENAFARYQKISFGEARSLTECWRSQKQQAA